MIHFTVLVTCDGPVRTGWPHAFRFSVEGHPVHADVRTWLEEGADGRGWLYRGLRLILRFTAPDETKAIQITEAAGEHLLDVVSLTAAADVPPFRMEALYVGDFSSDGIQVVRVLNDLGLPTAKLRKAYWNHLEPVVAGIGNDPKGASERLLRGMRWYRRALRQRTPIDRFLMLWVAVESLEPRLREHWDLEPDLQTCNYCGERLVCQACNEDQGHVHSQIGVDKLLEEIPQGDEDTGRACRSLRAGIVHAYRELPEVTERAKALSPVLEEAFPWGAGILLDLPREQRESLARPPLEPGATYDAAVRMNLRRRDGERFGPRGAFPFLEAEVVPEVEFDDRGEAREASYSAKIRAHIAEGVSVEYAGGWVPTRLATSVPISTAECSVSHSSPWLGEDAKGVGLWAKGSRKPWYPDGMDDG